VWRGLMTCGGVGLQGDSFNSVSDGAVPVQRGVGLARATLGLAQRGRSGGARLKAEAAPGFGGGRLEEGEGREVGWLGPSVAGPMKAVWASTEENWDGVELRFGPNDRSE
jgi:hypothetical protein